jgi:hypothetical protein
MQEIVIDALSGAPITDLIENWTFIIKEVAPYVFKAEGRDAVGHISSGAAGTAEKALYDCLKSANKIILRESRISVVKEKIKKVFRVGK